MKRGDEIKAEFEIDINGTIKLTVKDKNNKQIDKIEVYVNLKKQEKKKERPKSFFGGILDRIQNPFGFFYGNSKK